MCLICSLRSMYFIVWYRFKWISCILTVLTLFPSGDRLCGLLVRVPGHTSRGPGFDSWRYKIFWEVVDLERGPFSLVRITEKLLEWKSSGPGSRKSRLTAVGIRCADHATPSIRKLISPKSGRRSVGIVHLLTKATEFPPPALHWTVEK
jgi:hypothetical protein